MLATDFVYVTVDNSGALAYWDASWKVDVLSVCTLHQILDFNKLHC